MQPARKREEGTNVQNAVLGLSSLETQYQPLTGYQAVPSIVTMAGPPVVVVANSDPGVRSLLAAVLRKDGYQVFTVADGIELLEWLADRLLDDSCPGMPDIIVAEIGLAGRRGIDILADLRYSGLTTPFIFTARKEDQRMTSDAEKLGPVCVFQGPFEIDDFRTSAYCFSPPDKSRSVQACAV